MFFHEHNMKDWEIFANASQQEVKEVKEEKPKREESRHNP